MILEEHLELADAIPLNTGGAGTYLLGDAIDLGSFGTVPTYSDDGVGDVDTDLYLVIQVDTDVTSGGAATARFTLASDAQAAIATDGSATHHTSTGDIPIARLVAGYRVCALPLPAGPRERYLGVLQTTGVAALTGGKVNAFLTRNPGQWRAYANAAGAV